MHKLFTRAEFSDMPWETRVIECPDGVARIVSLPRWFFTAMEAMIAADVISERNLLWEIFDTAILQAGPDSLDGGETGFRNWFGIWIYELWQRSKSKILNT